MFASTKPYTAVTVHVDRLTGPEYEDSDLSGIVDLIEVVRIQDSGPTEAARAIRKKLKYGDAHRQLRALTVLDALMQNAGTRFQKRFVDEPLLERLRILPTDDLVDIDVRNRCNTLYRGWAATYKDTPGMQQIATLYKQLPKKQRPVASQSKVIRETEREAQENPFGTEEPVAPATPPPSSRRSSVAPVAPTTPSSSSHSRQPSHSDTPPQGTSSSFFGHSRKASKSKTKAQPFDLNKEKSNMLAAIAGASVASTNLLNAMRHLDREKQRVSEDDNCVRRFETCKALRRQILRYIQLVESDQWIGSLLNANDELVKALIAFEVNDKSIDDDSDSDTEMYNHDGRLVLKGGQDDDDSGAPTAPSAPSTPSRRQSLQHGNVTPSTPGSRRASLTSEMAGLRVGAETPPPKPPRPHALPPATLTPKRPIAPPQPTPIREDNEDDPFGDQNYI